MHPPPRGVFRIFQAPLDRDALGRRQLFEDFLLLLLAQRLEQFDGVVGFQFADTLRDRLGFELFENLLADGTVDFVQRREVEIGTGQFHQTDTVIRFKRPDQIAKIGLMQFRHDRAQQRRIGGMDRARDLRDELMADFAVCVAHRQMVEHGGIGGLGNFDLFGHATPRRFDRMAQFD